MNLALMATRPVIGNYFNGVLEGLVRSLGIKIHVIKTLLALLRKAWRNT